MLRIRFLLFSLITVALLVASCGGGDEGPTTATTAPGTATARPTPGPTVPPTQAAPSGQFRWALSAIPSYALLPGLNCCTNRYHLDPMYDAIVGMDENGRVTEKSGFATSWTVSTDGLSWTVKVRDGLTFHNGDKATAQDLQYSARWYESDQSNPARVPANSNWVSTEVVDPTTVVTRIKSPNIFYILDAYALSTGGPTGYLLPKTYFESNGAKLGEKSFTLETLAKRPVGSGPYKFKGDVVNQELNLEAAAGKHWFFGTPRYQTATFLIIPEDLTRMSLLKSGGAESAEIPRGNADEFKKAGFNVVPKSVDRASYIVMHEEWKEMYGSAKNPLSDLRVRQALSLAIDRDVVNKQFMAGLAQPTMNVSSSPLDVAFKEYPVVKQDLARAKTLMAQAGFANGFELEIWIWQLPGIAVESPQIMEAISVWWGELGIKSTRRTYDVQLTLAAMVKGFDHPVISGPWGAPAVYKVSGLRPGVTYKSQPYRFTEDLEIEAAAHAAYSAATVEQYKAQAQRYQELWTERVVQIPVFFYGTTYAIKAGLGGERWKPGQMALGLNTTGLLTTPDLLH